MRLGLLLRLLQTFPGASSNEIEVMVKLGRELVKMATEVVLLWEILFHSYNKLWKLLRFPGVSCIGLRLFMLNMECFMFFHILCDGNSEAHRFVRDDFYMPLLVWSLTSEVVV